MGHWQSFDYFTDEYYFSTVFNFHFQLSLFYRHDDQNDWNIIPELSGHRGPGRGVSTFTSADQIESGQNQLKRKERRKAWSNGPRHEQYSKYNVRECLEPVFYQ